VIWDKIPEDVMEAAAAYNRESAPLPATSIYKKPKTIKALSVRQPHAWGLIYGPKRVENRTWHTNHRGPTLIHAASSTRPYEDHGAAFWNYLYPGVSDLLRTEPDHPDAVFRPHFGCLYGLGDLIDCVPVEYLEAWADDYDELEWHEAQKPYIEGPQCWIFENPRPIKPVPYRGRTLLFDVPADLIEVVY
jgi:hypothetical protein